MSYFITETGQRINYHDIATAIDTLHPELRGRHIFQQLNALNLNEKFFRGTTPVALPYSFTEYLR